MDPKKRKRRKIPLSHLAEEARKLHHVTPEQKDLASKLWDPVTAPVVDKDEIIRILSKQRDDALEELNELLNLQNSVDKFNQAVQTAQRIAKALLKLQPLLKRRIGGKKVR